MQYGAGEDPATPPPTGGAQTNQAFDPSKPNPHPPGSPAWQDWESKRAQQEIHGDFGRDAAGAEAQRQADMKYLDPQCPHDYPYRSRKEGAGGACVEYPDNCPDGMTAWGANKCISASDPRVYQGNPGAAGAPGVKAPGAEPKGLSDLLSSGIYNRIADMYNLGMAEKGSKEGAFKLTGDVRSAPVGNEATLVRGGGLVWGNLPDAWKKFTPQPQ